MRTPSPPPFSARQSDAAPLAAGDLTPVNIQKWPQLVCRGQNMRDTIGLPPGYLVALFPNCFRGWRPCKWV